MTISLAQALFAPRRVALIGASGDPAKNTARPQRFLRKLGYAGDILPINPTRAEILGERAYPSLKAAHDALGGGIDHVFVMAPGEAALRAIEDCADCNVPLVSIFSDGFAETGPAGAARQAQLIERARSLGVRVLGPNSMGVIDIPGRLAMTVNAVLEGDVPPAGSTSVVSQSGTMLGTLLSRGAARGLGFSKLVSVGNEADIDIGELVELLVDDPGTRVIALFLETVRDAASLATAARRAHAAGKPVAVYKLSRSALGEAMARSHTGAMAGADAALDAFFRDCGMVRVELLETLLEIPPLLAGRAPLHLDHPPRVAVVTTTGGGAASVVDRLGVLGLTAMLPSASLKSELESHGVRVSDSPIVDLTMASSAERYGAVLAALIASPDCDAVLAVVGSSAQFHPDFAVQPILASPWSAKPLATFLTPYAERSLTLLAQQGIAAFRTPEACADALACFFRWRAPRERQARTTVAIAAPTQKRNPDEADALALFAALGVPVVASATAIAPDFRHDIAYPVVAKVRSSNIAHKTEAGGVLLGIANQADFAMRVPAMLRAVAGTHPRANITGVLVQRMEKGLQEVIVGYRHDAMVGPVIMVGAGGTLAEIYQDYALAIAPVSRGEALEMIGQVKGLTLIRGYRGLPRGDLAALAHAVAAFSKLALLPGQPVAEAEINPLIVRQDGVVAVDGLLVMRAAVAEGKQ